MSGQMMCTIIESQLFTHRYACQVNFQTLVCWWNVECWPNSFTNSDADYIIASFLCVVQVLKKIEGHGMSSMHIVAATNPAEQPPLPQLPYWMRPLVLCCARVCRASQLTGFHHHSSYLMSDCLWADKIKLQAWLISATGVFFLLSIPVS